MRDFWSTQPLGRDFSEYFFRLNNVIVHEIKFFVRDEEFYIALFDNPPEFCDEYWIKNIKAKEVGIDKIPQHVELEKK